MRIKSIEITELLGRKGVLRAQFNSDLNIITGRNGAGKTTVLKLLWYLVSGSIHHAISEIEFDSAKIETDLYTLSIKKISSNTCAAVMVQGEQTTEFEDIYGDDDEENYVISDARDQLSNAIQRLSTSLFFPTFRRIEGGFSTSEKKRSRIGKPFALTNELEEAMSALSKSLSNNGNTFVSSISTVDIEALLLKNYADLSDEYNRLQREVTTDVIDTIRGYEIEASQASSSEERQITDARGVIENVRAKIENMEKEGKNIMSPMTAVQKTVVNLLRHSGNV